MYYLLMFKKTGTKLDKLALRVRFNRKTELGKQKVIENLITFYQHLG